MRPAFRRGWEGEGKPESMHWRGPAGEVRHTGVSIPVWGTRGQSPWCSSSRIALRSSPQRHPCNGAKPPDALRPGLWASGRPAMREARVPAGQHQKRRTLGELARPECVDWEFPLSTMPLKSDEPVRQVAAAENGIADIGMRRCRFPSPTLVGHLTGISWLPVAARPVFARNLARLAVTCPVAFRSPQQLSCPLWIDLTRTRCGLCCVSMEKLCHAPPAPCRLDSGSSASERYFSPVRMSCPSRSALVRAMFLA